MNDQPTALARPDHPSTSHDAAEDIAEALPSLHAWAVACVTAMPGATARELAARYCPTDPRRIGRRLKECVRDGLLRTGEVRACRVSGKRALTWYIDSVK